MCRFVAYRGKPVPLAEVISAPEHSLIEQSYQPREMTAGTVNVDGFGVGWYNRALDPTPCIYTNIVPIWNDRNLPGLSRHIVSDCIVANVRSATPGFGLDQSNCQPFAYGRLSFMHNGFIEKARDGLLRKIREALRDEYYRLIRGSTDSEHIFALVLNFLHDQEQTPQAYVTAIRHTVAQLLTGPYGAESGAVRRGAYCRPSLREYLASAVTVLCVQRHGFLRWDSCCVGKTLRRPGLEGCPGEPYCDLPERHGY